MSRLARAVALGVFLTIACGPGRMVSEAPSAPLPTISTVVA
jgi:hypothetical protein